jgi:hypothetical protein
MHTVTAVAHVFAAGLLGTKNAQVTGEFDFASRFPPRPLVAKIGISIKVKMVKIGTRDHEIRVRHVRFTPKGSKKYCNQNMKY